jgi:hypothetical protein
MAGSRHPKRKVGADIASISVVTSSPGGERPQNRSSETMPGCQNHRIRGLAGGGGRTRTYEGVSQRIYSPPPLPLGTLPRKQTMRETPCAGVYGLTAASSQLNIAAQRAFPNAPSVSAGHVGKLESGRRRTTGCNETFHPMSRASSGSGWLGPGAGDAPSRARNLRRRSGSSCPRRPAGLPMRALRKSFPLPAFLRSEPAAPISPLICTSSMTPIAASSARQISRPNRLPTSAVNKSCPGLPHI